MKTQNELHEMPDELVINKIYFVRGQKIMLDKDLAELYGVETKQLKRQVNRKIERFPEDFMFELTLEENNSLRSQFALITQVFMKNLSLKEVKTEKEPTMPQLHSRLIIFYVLNKF